jgi:hypothetical protein
MNTGPRIMVKTCLPMESLMLENIQELQRYIGCCLGPCSQTVGLGFGGGLLCLYQAASSPFVTEPLLSKATKVMKAEMIFYSFQSLNSAWHIRGTPCLWNWWINKWIKIGFRTGSVTQAVECLTRKHEALSSNPSTANSPTKKTRQKTPQVLLFVAEHKNYYKFLFYKGLTSFVFYLDHLNSWNSIIKIQFKFSSLLSPSILPLSFPSYFFWKTHRIQLFLCYVPMTLCISPQHPQILSGVWVTSAGLSSLP